MHKLITRTLVCVVLAGICWMIFDAIYSTKRTQARVDKLAGGSLVRSMQLSDIQVLAHEILEANAENLNLDCLGNNDQARTKKLANFMSSNDRLTDTEKECLEKVFDGRASFLNIVKNRVTSIGDMFEKTIFDGNVSPRLNGAPLAEVKPGFKYTIEVRGMIDQWECDFATNKCYWQKVLPDGSLPQIGVGPQISTDVDYQNSILDGTQPVYMAVVVLGNDKRYFAHNGKVTFIAKDYDRLLLTANCRQAPEYFNNSQGAWRVIVKEVKI